MIKAIKFNGNEFEHIDDNDLLNLTKNTIILCANSDIKYRIFKVIDDICKAKCEEENDITCYSMGEEDDERGLIPKMKVNINYLPTTILTIDDEQTITLTIEAPFIFTAKEYKDIWFADINEDNVIYIYPFFAFKGYKEVWEEGLFSVYKNFILGRYGVYSGY